jgi:hypothetical protein
MTRNKEVKTIIEGAMSLFNEYIKNTHEGFMVRIHESEKNSKEELEVADKFLNKFLEKYLLPINQEALKTEITEWAKTIKVEKPKNKKSKKSDENKPKSALTPYFQFCQKHREEIKAEFPGQPKKVISELASKWKKLSDEEKIPYVDLYNKDKEALPSKKKKEGPKRAVSAYLHYCKDNRSDVSAEVKDAKKIISVLASRWKKLNDKEKEPYNEKARLDKERYNREKECHSVGISEDSSETVVVQDEKLSEEAPKEKKAKSTVKKSEKKSVVVKLNKGISKGFVLYAEENTEKLKEENEGISRKDLTSLLKSNWDELDEEEREEYEDRSSEE